MITAISVRLPKQLAGQLDGIAKETGRSRSFVIQTALESYVKDFAGLQMAFCRLCDRRHAIVSGKELRRSFHKQRPSAGRGALNSRTSRRRR